MDGLEMLIKGILAVAVLMLVFIPFACMQDMKQSKAYRKKCEDAGGVYYRPYKSRAICLDSANVKPITP